MGRTDGRIEIIDFLKGWSILGIVLYHLIALYMASVPSVLKYAANAGSSGVLIFFFCSGFVLLLSQERKPVEKIEFYRNKLSKIYFPYILIIIICAIIPCVPAGGDRMIAVLSHLFQFRMFSLKYFEAFGGHWWYLGTLFQFYLIFFALKKVLDLLGELKFIVLCMIVSIAYTISLSITGMEWNPVYVRLFPKYLVEFAAGMTLARFYMNGKLPNKIKRKDILLIIGLFGITIYGLSSRTAVGRLLNDIPAFIGFMGLFLWVYSIRYHWLNNTILRLGQISFELYLVHMTVFSLVFNMSDGTWYKDILCAVFAVLLSLLVAKGYHEIIRYTRMKMKRI